VADLDGDDDDDLVAATEEGLNWIENKDRARGFSPHPIEPAPLVASIAETGDLDGDGDLDLLTNAPSGDGALDWYENLGKGRSWNRHAIASGDVAGPIRALAIADGDADRDLDVVFAGPAVSWLANEDGKGSSWAQPVSISATTSGFSAVAVADFDGDGDNDLVAADEDLNEFIYLEDAGKSSRDKRVLLNAKHRVYLPVGAYVVDFNGDGDLDVFAVPQSNEVVLYDNEDGKGNLVGKALFKMGNLVMAKPADLDGDRDLDVVVACRNADEGIRWLENNAEEFEKEYTISQQWESPTLLEAVDLDRDGDLDILSVSSNIEGTSASWWENLNK
jgi:hypothetical protein